MPNYVVKKSLIGTVSIWCILFFWLIIPLLIQIVALLRASAYSIEFYENRMVIKSGILAKNERQSVFSGVYSVSVSRTMMGMLFGYGDVSVDCPGRWDIDTRKIKNPTGLKLFLERHITSAGMTNIIYN